MAGSLRVCAGCARHVRISETACPFCGAALPAVTAGPLKPSKGGRLTRAAVLFASATAVASCGSTETDDASNQPLPMPIYGVPAFDSGVEDASGDRDASEDAARDASGEAGQDGGGDASGDAASDANEGGIVPPYGLAPIDD